MLKTLVWTGILAPFIQHATVSSDTAEAAMMDSGHACCIVSCALEPFVNTGNRSRDVRLINLQGELLAGL